MEELLSGTTLLASGTIHSTDPVFCNQNGGKQEVPICAVALAAAFLNREWTDLEIDKSIHTGDTLYSLLEIPNKEVAIPANLPEKITINDPLVTVEVTENKHLYTYLYSDGEQTKYNFLHSKLTSAFKTSPPNSGFLFGSSRGFVAFVESDDGFLVFEPQGVGISGLPDEEFPENNTSRVFLCESLEVLAKFLLIHHNRDGSVPAHFTIVRMRFRLSLEQQRLQETRNSSGSDSDTPLAARLLRNVDKPAQPKDTSDSDTPLAARRPPAKKNHRKSNKLHNTEPDSDTSLAARQPANRRKTRSKSTPTPHCNSDSETPIAPQEPSKQLASRLMGESNPSEATTSPGVKNKGGRPKKVKRGRKAQYTAEERKQRQQDSQRRYYEKNKAAKLDARRLYDQEHPEVHRKAQQRYSQQYPEVHREAQQRYVENNPEARQAQRETYRAAHPARDKIRHLSADMQRLVNRHGPMAFWTGELLDKIEPYRLKSQNINANDIFKCQYCNAPLFHEETHTGLWCCGKGAYKVMDFSPLNADFYTHPEFLDRPRAYNDMFALSAMNISGGYRHPNTGLSFLKIEGRIYHKIYSLEARGQHTNFDNVSQHVNGCKLWIDDGSERKALAEGRKLNPIIIDGARSYLLANNPSLTYFRLLSEEPAEDARLDFQVTSREADGPVLGDTNPGLEVHAVVSSGECLAGAPRTLTVWKKADRFPTKINIFDPLMEPFQYPLLYPTGTPGWTFTRKDKVGRKLSQLSYARCLLLSEPRFTQLGRLSQAWQVEMHTRIEEERLQYIARAQQKNNANALRVASVDELQTSINPPQQVMHDLNNDILAEVAQDEVIQGEGARAGKIYLPSTFTGGPRYMKQKYMNAMGLVSRKGGPTYFLTFTACGGWDEMKASSLHRQRCDPSTCARIFHIKLKELLRDIRSGALFGPKAYIIYVIEMQMRGLPHAHICIRTEDGGPTQARDIDKVIRADIPSRDEAGGRLRKLVLKHMIHGPCGKEGRTDLPCYDDKKDKCNKYFPKPASDTTHIDDKGFVHYRRNYNNTDERYYYGRPVSVHEGWVIPYNPALLLKYEAHINLEIASTRRVIKYIYKYMHKGASHKNVRILPLHEQQDEPEEYATKRMVGASDACWRMLGFHLTVSEPTVEMLPVHLEGAHNVVFRPGEEQQALAQTSKLLLYLNRPDDPVFENLTYQQFYENYIIHTSRPNRNPGKRVYDHASGKHYLTPRELGECVCRLYWVSPNRGELYYLRLLLSSFPCRGFADLKAKGGEGCESFQETARRLGLIDNEQEYAEALRQASEFMVGPSLRNFFVTLASIGAPARVLWDAFKPQLCEDLLEKHTESEIAYKYGLIHIDRCLRRNGSCLTAHGLPHVDDDTTELGRQYLAYGEESQRQIYEEWLPRLTEEQRAVLEHVKTLVDGNIPQDQPTGVFLDGPGGYGKTALLQTITAYLRSQHKIPLCVASSGIAALNMEGGSTAHSMFRLPLDLSDELAIWNISNGTQRAELIRSASLIIFDEAPMAHKGIFQMLDRSLKDLMGNEKFMGGKPFLASGDFRQIPPVAENARTPSDTVKVSLKSSYLWDKFKIFKLTIPQRTRGSDEYSNYLLKVGNGSLPEETFGEGRDAETLVPLTPLKHHSNLEDLINNIYPNEILGMPDTAAERAILSTLNVNVKAINNKVLNSLPNREYQLLSFDAVDQDGDDGFFIDQETLHTAQGKGVPDHVLNLKIGAVCLITRNLNIEQGLVNGTKCVVESISPQLIRVRLPNSNRSYGIPRILFKFPIVDGSPMTMVRRQFPLQLAYAMTFHKSQGQTIKTVGLDLRTDCFTHGQLYVGLSRVRSPDDITVLVPPDRVHNGIAYTKNIIYRALLNQDE
ncbi:hypothetical protein FOCC_FOCC015928 [Frankliniella occidentalis]|uniref:ATP-dependent DNA helicase n=1 Tax=Frankliniella occidentalis TaxID=133901 RepID=A0A6J1TGF1_FRAOC|nr:uncharacterized protein LOC113216764 [Frankliniella occidentalis]KAE8738589.1 hypothetical protein FOCC_FOCC015928 [Frankliniella occidentalis]